MRYEKLKKRSLAALITTSVVAAVLLVNILVSYIASANILYLDLTKTNYTEITEKSEEYLSTLDAAENDITIYFLADKDELQNASFSYSIEYTGDTTSLWGMKYIYELALVYAEKYDFIKVAHLDISDDADKLEKYKSSISTTFNKQRIIIDNCIPEKDENGNPVVDADGNPVMHHNFRVCNRDYFYYFDSENYYAYGFNGELRFTSMIMSVAGQSPVAYFAYGHGEDIGDYTVGSNTSTSDEDYGDAQALRDYIYDSGFTVKKIDISKEYQTLLTDSSARLLIIFDPKNDFTGADAESDDDSSTINEIAVLRKFANRENCHLMVFSDPSDNELPNLSEYLYDYWGLSFDNSTIKDRGTNSLVPDGSIFMADYETSELSPGTSLTAGLRNLDSLPRIYFGNAGTISVNSTYSNEIGYYEGNAIRFAGNVFVTPDSAEITLKNGTVVDGKTADPMALMAITYEIWYNDKNNEIPTYVLACASTDYVSETALSNEYGNSDVIGYLLRVMGKDTFTFDVEMKVIETEEVETISQSLMNVWIVVICVIPPVISLVLGAVVFVKRRHA
ncbi:MAG: hypothetical protein E7633_02840 [Ruminococcaceae bacterium]|nr:hypothetical protein [Oscillospiraceae bacterium]